MIRSPRISALLQQMQSTEENTIALDYVPVPVPFTLHLVRRRLYTNLACLNTQGSMNLLL